MFSKIAAYQPDTNLIMNGDLQISVPNCSTNGCNIKSILKNSWISKNTDLGSLIGNTQCGNFRIYLPQIILLETNFVHFEAPKTSILTIWADLNFEFLNIFENSKSKASKIVKMTIFHFLKPGKIDFTENQSVQENSQF